MLAEGTLALVFGAYQSKKYLELRSPLLPDAPRSTACNRADPLASNAAATGVDYRAINDYRRDELQRKALERIPFYLGTWLDTKRTVYRYHFYLSSLEILIPTTTAHALGLHGDTTVDVDFDLASGPHRSAWATLALPSDAAARLGIRISKNGKSAWLSKGAASGVACANSIVDWLDGKLSSVSSMYEDQWGSDRYPFFGPFKGRVLLKSWNESLGTPRDRLSGQAPPSKWILKGAKSHMPEAEEPLRRGTYARLYEELLQPYHIDRDIRAGRRFMEEENEENEGNTRFDPDIEARTNLLV